MKMAKDYSRNSIFAGFLLNVVDYQWICPHVPLPHLCHMISHALILLVLSTLPNLHPPAIILLVFTSLSSPPCLHLPVFTSRPHSPYPFTLILPLPSSRSHPPASIFPLPSSRPHLPALILPSSPVLTSLSSTRFQSHPPDLILLVFTLPILAMSIIFVITSSGVHLNHQHVTMFAYE